MSSPEYRQVNGKLIQLSTEEIATREQQKKQSQEMARKKNAARIKREEIKSWEMQKAASARTKLRSLINGLDEEEAFAIIGKYGARIADMVTEKELMSDMTAQEIIAKKINE